MCHLQAFFNTKRSSLRKLKSSHDDDFLVLKIKTPHMYTFWYMYVYIFISVSLCMYLCLYVCVVNHTTMKFSPFGLSVREKQTTTTLLNAPNFRDGRGPNLLLHSYSRPRFRHVTCEVFRCHSSQSLTSFVGQDAVACGLAIQHRELIRTTYAGKRLLKQRHGLKSGLRMKTVGCVPRTECLH